MQKVENQQLGSESRAELLTLKQVGFRVCTDQGQ